MSEISSPGVSLDLSIQNYEHINYEKQHEFHSKILLWYNHIYGYGAFLIKFHSKHTRDFTIYVPGAGEKMLMCSGLWDVTNS